MKATTSFRYQIVGWLISLYSVNLALECDVLMPLAYVQYANRHFGHVLIASGLPLNFANIDLSVHLALVCTALKHVVCSFSQRAGARLRLCV
mgnify:CR=1 FL=1